MTQLTRTTLAIERDMLEKFDGWMANHGYRNRSEAMRDLIRQSLMSDRWEDSAADVVAVLSVIYDHHARTLGQELTQIQHEDHHAVMCSQHLHLSHEHCLEIIVMKGPVARVRKMADAIIATRGVTAGELTVMSEKM